MSRPGEWLRRRQRAVVAGLAVAGIAAGGYRIGREWYVGHRVGQAEAALDRRDVAAADAHLEYAARYRPDSGEVLFLSARAARLRGDPVAAGRLLREAERAGWVPDAVDIERALLEAQTGGFRRREPDLARWADRAAPGPDLDRILEVLVPGYIQEFRLTDAFGRLQPWVERTPDELRLRVWMLDIVTRLKIDRLSLEAAREVLRLAPADPDPRWKAAQALLDYAQFAEARPVLEGLVAQVPDHPDYRPALVRALRQLGEADAAAGQLAEFERRRPNDPRVFAERAYLLAAGGQPTAALPWYRRAVAAAPFEPELLYNFAVCLDAAGRPDEAKPWREKHARVEADLRRLTEVARAVGRTPRDPALRVEAGELLMRNGMEAEGVRWVESALAVDPRYDRARQLIAEYARRSATK